MLEYDRIDISEGIDINKANKSKKCDICHYWYFLNKNYHYEKYLCNGCHDLMQERERAKNKYRELSEEEKNTKREHGKNRYHNMSEENKKKAKRISKKLS